MCLAPAALLALAACSTPKVEPEIASSSGHASYAASYPGRLDAVVKDYAGRTSDVRQNFADWNSYPQKLKNPDWARVQEVIERADEDGRGAQFAERSKRAEAVATFFEAERDDINRKVAGAVVFGAKKGGCGPDVANGIGPALKDAVEKSIEKELDEASEAHLIIERYRVQLGKENAAELERQAHVVSRTSYLVHIELVEDKVKVQRLLQDASGVRSTADSFIAAEKTFQAEKKITEPEKKASQARIADMEKSKAALDASVQKAQELAPRMEEELKKLSHDYDDALAALVSKIKDAKSKQK